MENHCRVLKDKMNVSKADGILNLRKSMNFFFFFFCAWTDIKFQTLIEKTLVIVGVSVIQSHIVKKY